MSDQNQQQQLKTIDELNEQYTKADNVDKKMMAEQRSNIMMVSGEHYKKTSSQMERGLTRMGTNKASRIRLVKNHVQKITSDIKDIFLSQMSAFKPCPQNDSETSDVKSAELFNSVWLRDVKEIKFDDYVDRQTNSFVDIGEVAAKIFHDPNLGKIRAYEQMTSQNGQPIFKDPQGQLTTEPKSQKITGIDQMTGEPMIEDVEHEPAADEKKPIFTGKTLMEKIYAFNLLRDPAASTMDDSPYLIYRHMKDLKAAKRLAKDEETQEKITKSADRTYKIFDSTNGEFSESKGQVMIREFYFRQCHEYPKGYYYITTDTVIIDHGELPFGEEGEIAFPIKHAGYDIIETSPRYSSPIRPLRPYQAEINRTASAIAETQMVLGWDKMILKTGGTVSKGVDQPGISVMHVTGPDPKIIPGRDGSQYVNHLQNQIDEMYLVAKFGDAKPSANQVTDPQAELFKNVKQKEKFSRQCARLERFFISNVETYLFFQQKYLTEDQVIRAAGRKEAINVAEFKNIPSSDVAIKVEPVSGDFNSMFGKQIELTTIAQYFGKDLPLDVKSALIKEFPYMNKSGALRGVMVEYETPENMILALDRGEQFVPNLTDEAPTMLKRLHVRMRESDFGLLSDQVKQNYQMVVEQFNQIMAQQEEDQLRLTKGLIPTGGNLCKVDMYVMDESIEGKQRQVRLTLPSETIEWVTKAIEDQGLAQERLTEIANTQGGIDVGNMIPQDAFPNQLEQQPTNPGGF